MVSPFFCKVVLLNANKPFDISSNNTLDLLCISAPSMPLTLGLSSQISCALQYMDLDKFFDNLLIVMMQQIFFYSMS